MSLTKMGFRTMVRGLSSMNVFGTKIAPEVSRQNGNLLRVHRASLAAMDMQRRSIVSHKIVDHVDYLTNDHTLDLRIDPKTMKMATPNDRPLVVMLCWLGSTPKNIMKYASLHLEQGFDVVTFRVSFKNCLWVDPGVFRLATHFLNFLEQNLHTRQVSYLQGFSIGSFLYSMSLKMIEQDMDRYVPILNQFKVQVWDSLVTYNSLRIGIAKALVPDNEFLCNLLEAYIRYHFKKYYDQSTIHYMLAGPRFEKNNYCHSPALLFCSKADRVGLFEDSMAYYRSWTNSGIPVTLKIFEKSPHVGNYQYYPKEYLQENYNFLDKHNLLFKPELLLKRIENCQEKTKYVAVAQ